MKCQKLFITSLCLSVLTLSPIMVYGLAQSCESDHSSQADDGASSSDKGDSKESNDSGPSKGRDSSNTNSVNGDRDSNTPIFRGPCGDWLIFGDTDWCQDIGKD